MIHYFTTCYKYLEKNKKIFIILCICFWLFTFFSVAVEVPAWEEESEYAKQQKIKAEIEANKEIAIKEAPLEIVQ